MNRRARSLLAVGGWLAAAAAATTVGVIAIGTADSGIVGAASVPLTQDQVASALAGSSPLPSPQPATSTPAGTGVTRALTTPGGTIIARCTAGRATLLSWSPAQGYEADDIHRGPAPAATMKFKSGNAEIHITISCPGGIPTAHTQAETD